MNPMDTKLESSMTSSMPSNTVNFSRPIEANESNLRINSSFGNVSLAPGLGNSGLNSSTPIRTSDNIRSLIMEKEKELHDINEYRIRTLEGLLREKESASNEWKQKFHRLKEDFQYNIKLIEDRDAELDQYDVNFANLKNVLRERDGEISELKIQVTDCEANIKQQKIKMSEQETFYQKKIKEIRDELEASRWTYGDDQRKQREELENFKRVVERQLRDKEEDLDTQRREITITFDEVMRQRESEFKHRHELMAQNFRDVELKMKSQQREMEQTQKRNNELKSLVEELQNSLQTADKDLKAVQWEMEDTRQTKDAKIAELEDEKTDLYNVKQSLLDEYESKMTELLQSLHSVEKAFVQQKDQYEEELQRAIHQKDEEAKINAARFETRVESLTCKLRNVEQSLESVQGEFKQAKWEYEDQILQRQREIEAARADLQDTVDQRDSYVNELKNQVWNKEVEIKQYKDKLENVTRSYEEIKDKVNQQRVDLLATNEQTQELKRELLQQNINWENKWQNQERDITTRNEISFRELQQAKDRLLADKQAGDERIGQLEKDLERTRADLYNCRAQLRNQETFGKSFSLNNHSSPAFTDDTLGPSPTRAMGFYYDSPDKLTASSSYHPMYSNVQQLQEENNRLKNDIAQMRKEMVEICSGQGTENLQDIDHLKTQLKQQQDYSSLLQKRIQECEDGLNSSNVVNLSFSEHEELMTLRVQVGQLNTMINSYREQLDVAKSRVRNLERDLSNCQQNIKSSEELVKQKTNLIDTLQKQLQESTHGQVSEAIAESKISQMNEQLKEYKQEIERIMKERESLVDLNNSLRSDLNKIESEGRNTTNNMQSVLQKAEKEMASRYERKIADIETSMKEFKSHNKILKRELRRLIKGEKETSIPIVTGLESLTNTTTNNGSPNGNISNKLFPNLEIDVEKESIASFETMENENESPLQALAEIDLESESGMEGPADHEMETSIDNHSSSRRQRSSFPISSSDSALNTETSKTNLSLGSSLEKLNALRERRISALENSSSKMISGRNLDARLKLEQEVLELSGTKAPVKKVDGVDVRASTKLTASQKKVGVQLKIQQAKRSDIAQERKKVRNYSVTG